MDPQLLARYPGACGVGVPVQAAPLLDPCQVESGGLRQPVRALLWACALTDPVC